MKIAHLSSPFSWRGGEQQIAYLVEGLLAEKVDTEVWCPTGSVLADYCVQHQIPVHTWKKSTPFDPRLMNWLRKALKREQPDILHLHDAGAHTLGVLASQLSSARVPLVLHRRNPIPIKDKAFSRYKYNYAGIERIICISEAVKGAMLPGLNRRDHLRVIYSGIDPDRLHGPAPARPLRSELKLDQDVLLIGNVAAMSPQKDPMTWLEAVKRVLHQTEAHAVWVGDGEKISAMREWIHKEEWGDRIHLVGYRRDVPQLLPQFDLLCYTSVFEGLATSVLDAMVVGIPVAAAAVGGIPEYIRDGENGYLFEAGNEEAAADAMLALIRDPSKRALLGMAGRETALSFHKDRMVAGIRAVYAEILGQEEGNG